jgi:peptidoglycan hydrolase-like protein with peptidoglycan-binding domain
MKTLKLVAAAAAMVLMTVPHATAGDSVVRRAQEALKQAGHDPGPIDGVAGARTTAALRAYQQAQRLAPTGRLDDETLARLGNSTTQAGAPKQTKSQTQTGGDARPSVVDPAQASRTGANTGDGASYSRSSEKGTSAQPSASPQPSAPPRK